MMKKTPALIAAFVMTVIVGLGMLLVGANALFNPNSVALAGSPETTEPALSAGAPDQVQQLQALVAQYQSREKQYQQQVSQLEQQVTQSNTQVQQYQQLVSQLQRLGVIQISQNGQIQLPRGLRRDGD